MSTGFAISPAQAGAQARYVATTGEEFTVDTAIWRAPDGGHLNLTPGAGLSRADIDASDNSLWRYRSAIRVPDGERISLGEGWTPLVWRDWRPGKVAFKLEYIAPTGSFKDRGMSVMMTYLRAAGVKSILEDSSGNAGASMAAYSAAASMACRVLVPASAPGGKVVQIAAMGADVALVGGTRQNVAEQALREAEHTFYASHNWQPYFLEGTKTLAFELWEQFGFDVPDAVIVPLGYGSNVLGLWLGFNELLARGEIDRLPRIFAVQAENCAAFGAAWRAGVEHLVPFTPQPTIADGIASASPVRMKEVLSAVRNSGGAVVTVTETEIETALRRLLSHGLFVEPTSATAGAALTRLVEQRAIESDERTVVVLTGSGLKATDKIGEIMAPGQ